MKASLTIEVPDDFEKGDCLKCQYADKFFGGCKVKSLIKDLGSPNCPLEIQDEFTELEQKCLKHIGELIVENATLKENNQ